MGRHELLAALAACTALFLLSCQGGTGPEGAVEGDGASLDTPACVPDCAGRECGSNGCGGSCGLCDSPEICGDEGVCSGPGTGTAVGQGSSPGACAQSCSDLGLDCGEHCGESCGDCAGQDACHEGLCVCQPACSISTCEAADGCGADCGACTSLESCGECALKLSVVDQVIAAGKVQEITLALDYEPAAGTPLPALADLRIHVSGPASVLSVRNVGGLR